MRSRRRSLLRASGLAVATVAFGGLSGCTGRSVRGDGGTGGSWFPAPGVLGTGDHYQTVEVDPRAIDRRRDALSEAAYRHLMWPAPIVATAGIDPLRFDTLLAGEGFRVYAGDYDQATVESGIENALAEVSVGTYQGYTVYTSGAVPAAFAVGDEGIVFADGGADGMPGDAVRAVVDARTGSEPRYSERSRSMRVLDETLGSRPYRSASTHSLRETTAPDRGHFEGAIGWGVAADPGPEATTTTWAVAFEDAESVVVEDVRAWAESAPVALDDVHVSADGSVAIVDATVPTDAFRPYRVFPGSGPIYRDLPDPTAAYPNAAPSGGVRVEVRTDDGSIGLQLRSDSRSLDVPMTGRLAANSLDPVEFEDGDNLDPDTGQFRVKAHLGRSKGIAFDPGSFDGVALRAGGSMNVVVDGTLVAEEVERLRYAAGEGVVQRVDA